MDQNEWLILNYTLPKEPSRARVSAWRKLKKCGSISIGQSMWLLPFTKEHIDEFNEISNEIIQNNGKAYILKASFISIGNSEDIVEAFNKARDDEYKEVLEKCEDFFYEIEKETKRQNYTFPEVEENEYEYNKIVEWYKKVTERDFFTASLKTSTGEQLEKCKDILDVFCDKVYELNGER